VTGPVCIRQYADGGVGSDTGFTGGYCTASCSSSNCGSGALCLNFGDATTPLELCVQTCTTPNAGQGNCRSGYVCQALTDTATMQTLPFGFCFPRCRSTSCTAPRTCGSDGYCT